MGLSKCERTWASLCTLLCAITLALASDRCHAREQDDGAAVEVERLRRSASYGNHHAMNELGYRYENGDGVRKNDAEALFWYVKAAWWNNADAMNNVGRAYQFGRGVTQCDAAAVSWYRKAADAGAAVAMFNLGWMYHFGRGVAEDGAEALKWYRKAADNGYLRAYNNIGRLYGTGRDVPLDHAEALVWYRRAAAAGDAMGVRNIGRCYEEGDGVAQDPRAALRCYRQALAAGEPLAAEDLQRLLALKPGHFNRLIDTMVWTIALGIMTAAGMLLAPSLLARRWLAPLPTAVMILLASKYALFDVALTRVGNGAPLNVLPVANVLVLAGLVVLLGLGVIVLTTRQLTNVAAGVGVAVLLVMAAMEIDRMLLMHAAKLPPTRDGRA